jgi:hypothetical protein
LSWNSPRPEDGGHPQETPFGALDLEGEIPLRKLNKKIDLKPIEGPQIEEMGIRGHVPGLFVHLRGDEALEFKPVGEPRF